MGGNDESPTSSIDSSHCPAPCTSSHHQRASDLSTDLRLGLSLSSSSSSSLQEYSSSRENGLPGRSDQRRSLSLFVKVYMEGIPIGRKLDLYAHDGYADLINALRRMFHTTIVFAGIAHQVPSDKVHVVTYEDKDGVWMMVGDTSWELFLTTVRRLKVTRAIKC